MFVFKNMRLEPAPSKITHKKDGSFAVYDIRNNRSEDSLSLSAFYDSSLVSAPTRRPEVSVSSVLGGTDQMSGVLVSVIRNGGSVQRVVYTHQIPWFLHIYYHTIALTCKDLSSSQKQVPLLHNRYFVPAIARMRPALIEIDFDLPANAECKVQFKFEKAFLRL
ncbi:hypothetical protein OESDEN_20928, partial [Oesophagostomum dentatum]